MKTINIEYKAVTASKITIAKDEIRIKISSNLDVDDARKHEHYLMLVAEVVKDIKLEYTARFTINNPDAELGFYQLLSRSNQQINDEMCNGTNYTTLSKLKEIYGTKTCFN